MISRNEYKFLNEVEKNNMSEEMLSYSVQPEFVIRINETIVIDEIKKENKEIEDYKLTKEDRKYKLISKLIDRKYLEVIREKISIDKNEYVRIFRITQRGYDVMDNYKNRYKFWIPIFISIISLLISLYISINNEVIIENIIYK